MKKHLKFNFRSQTYRVTFNLKFFLLNLIIVVLFFGLSIWQLHRYHYKNHLLSQLKDAAQHPPQLFLDLVNKHESLQFKSIITSGYYRNDLTILMQNRVYEGQIGYEVFTPFMIPQESKLLLIDRGWIPNGSPVEINKLIRQSSTIKTIYVQGQIKLLNEYQFILGKNILFPNSLPLVVQKIDVAELAAITHMTYFPLVLRLDPLQPYGFHREALQLDVTPSRHLGYAIQWILLAGVVIVSYIIFCCEKQA